MLLPLAIDLGRSIRNVVQANVAENIVGRFNDRDVLRLATNNDGKFSLPIELYPLARAAGDNVLGAGQGRDCLQENLRLHRRLHFKLFNMLLVIEACSRDLSDTVDRSKVGELAVDGSQTRRIDVRQRAVGYRTRGD